MSPKPSIDPARVTATERGLIRLFAIDLPGDAVASFAARPGPNGAGWPLCEALGATDLDMAHVDVIDIADLEGVGLFAYMRDGLGIVEAQLGTDRARLDALTGHVLAIRSAAFAGTAQQLTIRPPLAFIGLWAEDRPPVRFDPIASESATGTLAGGGAPPARTQSPHLTVLIAIVALPLILGIVGLIFWGVSR